MTIKLSNWKKKKVNERWEMASYGFVVATKERIEK